MIRHRRYHLSLSEVEALDDQQAAIALRIALKRLLRSFGLRCTAVVELPPEPERAEPNASH